MIFKQYFISPWTKPNHHATVRIIVMTSREFNKLVLVTNGIQVYRWRYVSARGPSISTWAVQAFGQEISVVGRSRPLREIVPHLWLDAHRWTKGCAQASSDPFGSNPSLHLYRSCASSVGRISRGSRLAALPVSTTSAFTVCRPDAWNSTTNTRGETSPETLGRVWA